MIDKDHSQKRNDTAPFLKWAGGKQWLAPTLKELMVPITGKYIEPFLGGAAAFFSIRPQRALLSDRNEELIETYLAIKHDADPVIELLSTFSFTRNCYYRVRGSRPCCRAAKAARLIYLNRTCWNGLYRVNRRGEFNVPMGSFQHTPDLIMANRLRDAERALKQTRIFCDDFENACEHAQEGDAVYLDPPYTAVHGNNGFRRYNGLVFSWRDQLRLARVAQELKERGVKVVISNADDPAILALYRGFNTRRVSRKSLVAGSRTGRRAVTELLIFGSPE